MKKLFLLLVAVLSIGLAASAQTRTVTGTVIEASSDEPMLGVSVLPYGQTRGVQTDIDGHYSITVPTSVTKLTFSFVGMAAQTLDIPANNKLDVTMQANNNVLDEVMVVAYGTTTKAAYTGSAATVDAAQLEDALVSNVTNAFSGKMAGVQTLSSNGQPGTGSTVLIRGVGSINASSSPLWVVNGMPYDGDISAIPTSDIESVTVLKDAASTALYGARGANGVILVTTKKGDGTGQAKVTLDARLGVNSRAIPLYDYITDQRQYLETAYQCLTMTRQFFNGETPEQAHAWANANIWQRLGGYQTWTIPEGMDAFGTNGKFNPYATPGYNTGRYYLLGDDWSKESLIHGLRQEYTMSITGGNDRLNYYVSGSYLGDEGIIKNSHFNRLSARTTIDYQAKPWLKVGTQMGYVYTNSAYPDDQTTDASSANVFYLLNQMGPLFPIYVRDTDGKIMHNPHNGNPVYDYGDGADYGNGRMGTSRPVMLLANPVSDNIYSVMDYLSDIFDAKWYATITPFKGFSATETLSYYVDNTRVHQMSSSQYGQSANYGGAAIQEADRYRSLQSQTLASYSFNFGDHNFDILGAYETQEYQTEGVWGQKQNLYNPNSWVVDNAIDNPHAGGSQTTLCHRGWLGKFNYNYDNKYFFMASIRRDGSSRFAPDKRWGTFWSASAAWDIDREAFMRDYTWINLLKFKASFGQNGNDGIGGPGGIAYLDMYRMQGSDGIFSDATLYYKGNPNITWETSNSSNIGIDFAFWNGKFQGSVEWFNRQTSDMLFNIPVAPSLGYSSIPMNVGSMRNSGFEIDLSYDLIKTRKILLSVSANITFQKNKLLKLDSSIIDEDGYQWLSEYSFRKEGESIYQLALPKYAGVDEKNGEALYWALQDRTNDAGDVAYYNPAGQLVYVNADGKVMPTDANGDVVMTDGPDGTKVPVISDEKFDKKTYKVIQDEVTTNDYYTARKTDKWHTGNIMPKAYGGFSVDLKLYGFDFSAQFAYQLGGRLIDYGYQGAMNPGSSSFGQNWHKDILNAWTPENTHTDVPRLYTDANYPYATALSDRFLISSNYLSLNNVTVGYTVPKKLLKSMRINSLRLYASAENVWLWSKRKGLDPRQGFMSSDNSVYSPIRAISGGVKVEF